MIYTMAYVIFIAAIVVFFSDEIISFIKRVFEIRGALLLLPLVVASWAAYAFSDLFLWLIHFYREFFHTLVSLLAHLFPFTQYADQISTVILFTAIAIGPVVLWDIATNKRAFKWYRYSYFASSLVWIITVFVMIVP